jgi:hypothetical protein
MTAGGSFTHKTTTEQRKILDHILEKHASTIVKPNHLLKKVLSSFEEPSSAKSLPLSSLDSTIEPSPEPETPKEGDSSFGVSDQIQGLWQNLEPSLA